MWEIGKIFNVIVSFEEKITTTLGASLHILRDVIFEGDFLYRNS